MLYLFCSTVDSSVLAQQVNRARGLDPHARAENEVERSAHRETMEALELSEQSVSKMRKKSSIV